LMAVEDVKYCVMETDGKVSVIPKRGATQKTLPLILISDGVPVRENLRRRGLNEEDLAFILRTQGIYEPGQVFLLYEISGRYTCIPQKEKS